jgi:hypothetical protein
VASDKIAQEGEIPDKYDTVKEVTACAFTICFVSVVQMIRKGVLCFPQIFSSEESSSSAVEKSELFFFLSVMSGGVGCCCGSILQIDCDLLRIQIFRFVHGLVCEVCCRIITVLEIHLRWRKWKLGSRIKNKDGLLL